MRPLRARTTREGQCVEKALAPIRSGLPVGAHHPDRPGRAVFENTSQSRPRQGRTGEIEHGRPSACSVLEFEQKPFDQRVPVSMS